MRRNSRKALMDKGLQMEGYLNCKLFVQQLTGVCRIQDLPSKPYNKRTLKIGDILAWWNGLHYAIYLGNDDVMEVEEWGASPRISRLQDVIAEHDEPEYQYTIPKQNPRTISSSVGEIDITQNIPNKESLRSSYSPNEYKVLGLELIPARKFGSFDKRIAKSGYSHGAHDWFYGGQDLRKAKALRKAIAKNKWIDPLIVGKDEEGLFVLEGQHRYVALRELGASHIPALLFQEVTINPRRNPRTTTLVPKERVRMKGFSKAKTKVVEPEIPYVLALIEDMVGRSILFPTPIRPMTRAEFEHGRSVVDSGHPMGAGHGQYDSIDKEVAINGNMEPFDLITNIFHENLHHARPDLPEEVVRDTTGEAMLYLYGEYNLGRPYAEERERNPRRNRKAETRDSKGRLIPEKYLSAYTGAKRKARIKEIEQRRDEYDAALDKYGDEDKFPQSVMRKLYRPFETDKGVKSKKSSYTKEAHKRGFDGGLKQKQQAASQFYGGTIPLKVLKTVMNRGRAAWASGGHRGGQTPESWGYARVNSFLVGGKTFWTADADQVLKLPKNVAMNIADKSVFSPSLSVLWA